MSAESIQRPGSGGARAGRLREAWESFREAATRWVHDNAVRLSAAVAMYTMLSLSPLLVITIKLLAVAFGEEAASHQIQRQVLAFLGPTGAEAVRGMVVETARPGAGVLATAVSMVVLLFTASGVFAELRDSLNAVWGITPKYGAGWCAAVCERFQSIGMVFVVGFLLLVSQAVTTALTALSEFALGGVGRAAVPADLAASTLVVTLLFAMIFRFLPDARPAWRDVLTVRVGRHGSPVQGGAVPARPVLHLRLDCVGVRRGGVVRGGDAVGVLLLLDPLLRGGTRPGPSPPPGPPRRAVRGRTARPGRCHSVGRAARDGYRRRRSRRVTQTTGSRRGLNCESSGVLRSSNLNGPYGVITRLP